ncbi:hypothetical protein FE257_009301 [Aspergillus nanangensis]|uniref:glutathione transferase n=1 Tax=Aspergillus nanangensis TaxID=2582783 RepID=A0AAD4CKN1_ASPNN|nr:hypothetical protein FE257_009301 [Aspergillus nanangensis]
MVLKLYGSAMATSRVLVTILEKELPYELILVDISQGHHKTDEYRKMQPFGKVPVLDDEEFVMFESRAICKYPARKYPSGAKLIPGDNDEAYGRFEQACSIEQSHFAAAAETIGTEPFIKAMKGLGPPDEAKVAQAEEDLDLVLSVYGQILSKQKYIAGDELTVADLFHLPNGAALMAGKWKDVFAKYPNVDKWFKELQGRETWVRAASEAGTIL